MNGVKIDNLSFQYDNRDQSQKNKVFDGISLHIKENESVGIIGENGVGKSTLLKILVGLLPGFRGNIEVDNLTLNGDNLTQIRSRMGYVFQDSDSQLFLNTVYEDVAFGPRNYGYQEDEVRERAMGALEKTHTEDLKDRHIYKLSGGQKKLVSIATILSMGSEIILMDEPSVALDPGNRDNLIEILNELQGIRIIASHDLDFIYDTCERTILLSHGKVAFDGKTKDILRNQEMLEANGLRLPLSFRFMQKNNGGDR